MMPYGWEGNRRSSHWQCVTDFSGLSTYGLNGLREGDEHPAYTLCGVWLPLPFLTCINVTENCCFWRNRT